MENLKLRAFVAVAVAFLAAGCASKLAYVVSPPRAQAGAEPAAAPSPPLALLGAFETIDGSRVDLDTLTDKPVVLIFSQDTCTVCAAEADALRKSLANPTAEPTGVHLYTVLVGAILQDGLDWHHDHPVPWPVGIDPGSALFKRYCDTQTVPCTLAYVRGRGIALVHNGPISRAEIEAVTGPWQAQP